MWNSQQRPGGFRKKSHPPISPGGIPSSRLDPRWAGRLLGSPGRAQESEGRRQWAREPALPFPRPFQFLPSARTVVFFLNLARPPVLTGTAGPKAGARRLGQPGARSKFSPRRGKAGDQPHQAGGAPPRQSHHTSVMRCLQQTFVESGAPHFLPHRPLLPPLGL